MIKDATMFLEEIESNFDIDSLTGEDFEEIMCTDLSARYDYAYGASKGVMFPIGEYDEVIKLPLFYSDGYDFDHDLRLSANYCDIEYENYIKAQEYGVAQYFAALRFLGSFGITLCKDFGPPVEHAKATIRLFPLPTP